jgi:hypothetical protein
VSTSIKAINPHSNPLAISLAFFTPGRPAGHQWQAAGRPVPYPPHLPSSGLFLSSRTHPCASLCLCNALTHTPSTNFTVPPPRVPAAAVDPSPPVKARPPPVFFDLWDR